jgi:hypothetical protein
MSKEELEIYFSKLEDPKLSAAKLKLAKSHISPWFLNYFGEIGGYILILIKINIYL